MHQLFHVERPWQKTVRGLAIAGAAGAVACGALAYPSAAIAAPQALTGLTAKAAAASGRRHKANVGHHPSGAPAAS